MKNIFSLTRAYTHGGVFHADDVFSTAFLKMLNPGIKVVRTNKVTDEMSADEYAIIFDIGGGVYDHHQADKAVRPIEDGHYFDSTGRMCMIPYCSFGLLWHDYGRIICNSDKAWKKVDRDLVIGIDKADNGIAGNALASAIAQFNPSWNSIIPADEAFDMAVNMASSILKNYINNANADFEAESIVRGSKVVDSKILVLDKYVPWQDVVVNEMHDVLFVIFPSNRGGYNVQTVPNAPGSFVGRKLFPTAWLGNPDKELGMTFCHPGNFILSAETLDQAINCAKIAIEA